MTRYSIITILVATLVACDYDNTGDVPEDGADGAQGPAGEDGKPGEDGRPGEDGTDGTDGADGQDADADTDSDTDSDTDADTDSDEDFVVLCLTGLDECVDSISLYGWNETRNDMPADNKWTTDPEHRLTDWTSGYDGDDYWMCAVYTGPEGSSGSDNLEFNGEITGCTYDWFVYGNDLGDFYAKEAYIVDGTSVCQVAGHTSDAGGDLQCNEANGD